MNPTEQLTDDTPSSMFDDERVEAVAASIATSFDLGSELEIITTWPGDGERVVLAVPFVGVQNGTLLVAVSSAVSERLLFDRARLGVELQQALDTLGDSSLRLGDVGESSERPSRCVEIKDERESGALVGFLSAATDEAQAPDQQGDGPTTAPQPGSWTISDEDLRLLDVLGDIRVVVKAELGRVTMPLSAVLGMLPGTVFELGQIVTEPIDLLVDGSVVGHGDVVAVDDHFGVRVVGLGAQPPPDYGRAQ